MSDTLKDIERYRGNVAYLLLFVNKTVLNDLDKCSQMGEDCATHTDGNLLDNLNHGVTGL